MADEIVEIKNEENKKKRSLLALLFLYFTKFVSWTLASLVAISISLALLLQFSSFRSLVINQILKIAEDSLEAKVELGDLRFTNVWGLELIDVRLITRGDTLAYIPRLIVDIDYSKLSQSVADASYIYLENPVLKMLHSKSDSTWNVAHIAKPSNEIDTSKSQTFWKINAKRLHIKNATFYFIDSVYANDNASIIDFTNLHIKKLNIKLSANIDLGRNDFIADINEFSAVDNRSGIMIDEFKTKAHLTANYIEAKDLKLRTGSTEIDINAKMDNYDVLTGKGNSDIANVIFDVDASADNLYPQNILHIAAIDFPFDGIVDMKLKAKGTLNKLQIEESKLRTNNTNIELKGKVENLLKIEKFKYDIYAKNSQLDKNDLQQILPGLNFNQMPNFELMKISNLHTIGGLDSVWADFESDSKLGNIKGNAGIGYGKSYNYFANVSFKNLDIQQIIRNNQLNTKLNGRAVLQGSEFDLQNIVANARIDLDESQFRNVGLKSSKLIANIDKNAKIRIDSLMLEIFDFANPDALDNNTLSMLYAEGDFDFANIYDPKYKFDVIFDGINLKKMTQNEAAPAYFSGKFVCDAKGIELDSLEGKMKFDFDLVSFDDRTLLPFSIDFELNKISDEYRTLKFNSDYFDISANGKFSFGKLISSVQNQGFYFANFITNKINTVIPSGQEWVKELPNFAIKKTKHFDDVDFTLSANIKDIPFLTTFVDSLDIQLKGKFDLRLKAKDSLSEMTVDTFRINRFYLNSKGFELTSRNLDFDGGLYMSIKDSMPSFSYFDLVLMSEDRTNISSSEFLAPKVALNFDGRTLKYNLSSTMNTDMNFLVNGESVLVDGGFDFDIDKFSFAYKDLKWTASDNLIAKFDTTGFEISKLEFERENAEKIKVSGKFNERNLSAVNILVNIDSVQLVDWLKFLPQNLQDLLNSLDADISNINLNINGNVANPEVLLKVKGTNLVFNDQNIGDINADFKLQDSNLVGNAGFSKFINKSTIRFRAEVKSFPLSLSLLSGSPGMHAANEVEINAVSENLPLKLAEPFVPGITDFEGEAKFGIRVYGRKDDIKYGGGAEISNALFRTLSTNLYYKANGHFSLINDRVNIDSVIVKNVDKDLPNGIGKATGYALLKDFLPDYVDIKFTTPNLLVMSEATKITMPFMYGKFRMATGDKPIHFWGKLKEPELEGDINILESRLYMPQPDISQLITSKFKYETKGDRTIIKVERDTTLQEEESENEDLRTAAKGIADLINYDLNIKFLGKFDFLMDIALTMSLDAKIGTPDKAKGIKFIKKRTEQNAELLGEISVLENSIMKMAGKSFTTGGKLSFPNGNIENPTLDLTAGYKGKTQVDNKSTDYDITIFIKGTKQKPEIKWTYKLAGQEVQGEHSDIQKDIVFLLTLGKTPKEMAKQSTSIGSSLTDEATNSALSYGLSSALTQLAGNTGLIKSADIDWTGSFETSKIKLQGNLFGDLQFSIGGQVQGNREYQLELPLSAVWDIPFMNNFLWQVKYLEQQKTAATPEDVRWELKLKVRGSW